MNYQESRSYVEASGNGAIVLGLEGMRELLRRLGNPQDQLRFVHVAGTNGKGSVIACLYGVLRDAGYRVGRYVSPALYSYRERMEVCGERISRDGFAKYMTRIARVIEGMTGEGLAHPTPFEIETAVAFLFFQEKGCELVLLEVGMGGDQDATNVVQNTLLAVLTPISMDHMDFLGHTLEEIAEKKAGILKPGCIAVTARQEPEAEAVIQRRCREKGIPLYLADGGEAELCQEDVLGQTFVYQGRTYRLSLGGAYQKENGVTAIRALQILGKLGFPVGEEQMRESLARIFWRGRFTVLGEKPLLVVDGAHNPAAARCLADSIRRYFPGKRLYYIVGIFRDKDHEEILRVTAPFAEKILTIQTPGNPRALPAEELALEARRYHGDVQACASIPEALSLAHSLAGEEDVILAFGSLSFIGDLTRVEMAARAANHSTEEQENE
ncbi:MAG: folylpolyglutamate synthase/dihydrofolate synthase family protein [Eubacteriales bacterium]|nr:folylpolyglutamate synthase/dihydrofolate synthase family protein [Eubacteriales bacterium]